MGMPIEAITREDAEKLGRYSYYEYERNKSQTTNNDYSIMYSLHNDDIIQIKC